MKLYQNWNLKKYPLNLLIQIVKPCLHKQRILITETNLNFENTVIIVVNLITLLQSFSGKNKMEKENAKKPIPDRNHPKVLQLILQIVPDSNSSI